MAGLEFDEFVRARGAALVRLARLLIGDRHRGEDLAREVLARAFVRWTTIAGMDSPEAYLRRMLVNAAITRWRLRSSREFVVPDTGDSASRVDLESEVADRDVLWRYVRQLPAKQRAATVLRCYEDLDDASIAELLGCSVSEYPGDGGAQTMQVDVDQGGAVLTLTVSGRYDPTLIRQIAAACDWTGGPDPTAWPVDPLQRG